MMYTHEWRGTTEELHTLSFDVGRNKIKVMSSLDLSHEHIQVFDDHKKRWVLVRIGDYIIENEGVVWVTSGR